MTRGQEYLFLAGIIVGMVWLLIWVFWSKL